MKPPVVLALSQILVEGCAFLRNLILARVIGAEQMGLAVALALGIRLLEMLGDFGLERLLVQTPSSQLPQVRGTVYVVQAVKGCLLMGIAALVALPLCSAVNPALEPSIFVLAAAVLLIRGFINCDYRERQRNRDFNATLYVDGISNVVATIAIVPVALATRDYSALAWASALQAVVVCLLSHLVAERKMAFVVDSANLQKALRFGIPIAFNSILIFFALQGDRLIVATNFPPEDLARFAIAAQLTLLPALMGARFLLTLDLPRFSRLHSKPAELREQFEDRMKRVVIATAVMAIFFACFGNHVVGWLYGPAFVSISPVMTLLALVAALRLIRAVPNTLLMSTGKTAKMLVCNLPRLVALPVALVLVHGGGGLVSIVVVGLLSEATSLLVGLGMVATIGGGKIRLNQSLLQTPS